MSECAKILFFTDTQAPALIGALIRAGAPALPARFFCPAYKLSPAFIPAIAGRNCN